MHICCFQVPAAVPVEQTWRPVDHITFMVTVEKNMAPVPVQQAAMAARRGMVPVQQMAMPGYLGTWAEVPRLRYPRRAILQPSCLGTWA